VSALYPLQEPHEQGLLDVGGEGIRIYWEVSGNRRGKPAVVLHGGPGSGASPSWRQLFDPSAYQIVLFDQRNCGRSTPHASQPVIDLSANTTQHLVGDIERLRQHLGIGRWLVIGGSWGSTLALAYAEAHPQRVSELVLFGVTAGRHAEFDWTFRGGLARFFPVEWQALVDVLPAAERGSDVVAAYHERLMHPDPAVHRPAAEAWCLWESATPAWPPQGGLAERFRDPAFALAWARIVTHYAAHNAWLEDGALLRDAHRLAGIPGVLVNGRFDFQAPLENAWLLRRHWAAAELVVVDDAGHLADDKIDAELVRATNRFARGG
jgi:proline iminopeptidase